MNEKIFTVRMKALPSLAEWYSCKGFLAKMKEDGVEGTFHDDGITTAFWTLKGPRTNVMKVINDYCILCWCPQEQVLDKETMDLLGFYYPEE